MGSAKLNVSDSAKVDVADVSQKLSVKMSGAGKVKVRSGNVTTLVCDTSGASGARLKVRAIDAELEASGASRIDVDCVTGSLSKDTSGAASITVRSRK